MFSATNYGAYGYAVNELFRIRSTSPQHFNGIPLKLKPSFPDARNYQYSNLIKQAGLSTEVRGPFGYRKNLPPVFKQIRGDCTAASKATTVKAFQEINQGDFPINGLSVAFLYAEEKKIDGAPNDEGSDPKSGYVVLQKIGICTEDTMRYNALSDLPAPKVPVTTAAARQEAAKYKIDAYAQISSPGDIDRSNVIGTMRQALAKEGPFTIGILICENFAPDPRNNFIVPLPNGMYLGLHETSVIDDLPDIGCFEVRNTWGDEWGDGGYCNLPYEWFTKRTDLFYYCFESWTSTDLSVPKAANQIEIPVGSHTMLVDGKEVYLDVPAQLINGRIMVPVRAIATNEGYNVLPSDGTKAVLVRQTS
jgi:hypothetical protein